MAAIDVTDRRPATRPRGPFLPVAAAILVIAGTQSARGQDDAQHRLQSFQAPASDNLESAMLSRLSATGEFQPGDLPRLARLAVLESISMLVNVRADMPRSVAGSQLEQELTALWNTSEAFYEVVSTAPADAANVALAQQLLEATDAAFGGVEASLGQVAGLSPRAASDLKSFSRLLGNVNSAMEILEASAASGYSARAGTGWPRFIAS